VAIGDLGGRIWRSSVARGSQQRGERKEIAGRSRTSRYQGEDLRKKRLLRGSVLQQRESVAVDLRFRWAHAHKLRVKLSQSRLAVVVEDQNSVDHCDARTPQVVKTASCDMNIFSRTSGVTKIRLGVPNLGGVCRIGGVADWRKSIFLDTRRNPPKFLAFSQTRSSLVPTHSCCYSQLKCRPRPA
jgi:hypothetical protein